MAAAPSAIAPRVTHTVPPPTKDDDWIGAWDPDLHGGIDEVRRIVSNLCDRDIQNKRGRNGCKKDCGSMYHICWDLVHVSKLHIAIGVNSY